MPILHSTRPAERPDRTEKGIVSIGYLCAMGGAIAAPLAAAGMVAKVVPPSIRFAESCPETARPLPARRLAVAPGRRIRCDDVFQLAYSRCNRFDLTAGSDMHNGEWKIRGEYMESCNCDYVCPCILTNSRGSASNDNCTSIHVYRIDEGAFGGVDLAGLKFALVIRSGRIMSDGNWAFACVVDARADESQRRALVAIASGEAGGPPASIRDNLVSDFRGVEFRPIEFMMSGLIRTTSVADAISFAIEGVESTVEPGAPLYIDNTEHPANRRVALAQATKLHVDAFGLQVALDNRGNNGHFAPFAWAGRAPV